MSITIQMIMRAQNMLILETLKLVGTPAFAALRSADFKGI